MDSGKKAPWNGIETERDKEIFTQKKCISLLCMINIYQMNQTLLP